MDINYRKIAKKTVKFAKNFNAKLDYTTQSIQKVDEILGMYFDRLNEYGGDSGENTLWNIAVHFGIYIGETLLKNGLAKMGFKWFVKGSLPVLRNELKNIECSPITKAHKRILNGSGDSVVGFYNVSFIVARGELSGKDRCTD